MDIGFIREAVEGSGDPVVGEILNARKLSTPEGQQQRVAVVANVDGKTLIDTVEVSVEGYDPQAGDSCEFGRNEDGDVDNFPSCKKAEENE